MFGLGCFQQSDEKDTVFIDEVVAFRGQDEDLRDHPAEKQTPERISTK